MKKYISLSLLAMMSLTNSAYAGGKEVKEIIFCGMNIGAFPLITYYGCYAALGSLLTCMGGPGFCFPALAFAAGTCGLSVGTVKGVIRNCMK